MNIKINKKDDIILKILHYFITEEDYKPVIINGLDNEIWLENMENDLIYVGMVGMIDPPREEVKIAVEKCKLIKPEIIHLQDKNSFGNAFEEVRCHLFN